jgi:hypothetical protein
VARQPQSVSLIHFSCSGLSTQVQSAEAQIKKDQFNKKGRPRRAALTTRLRLG